MNDNATIVLDINSPMETIQEAQIRVLVGIGECEMRKANLLNDLNQLVLLRQQKEQLMHNERTINLPKLKKINLPQVIERNSYAAPKQ